MVRIRRGSVWCSVAVAVVKMTAVLLMLAVVVDGDGDAKMEATTAGWSREKEVSSVHNEIGESTDYDSQVYTNVSDGNVTVEGAREKRALTCPISKYRSCDGHCNNLLYSKWGQSFKPYARLILPHYQDGKESPRSLGLDGSPLPCARCVSLHLAQDIHREYPTFTHMLMQIGQFINHDLTNKPVWTDDGSNEISCCGEDERKNPECFPIDLPYNDPFFAGYQKRCMNFVRSKPYPGRDYITPFREQYNENTAFIDASGIYGSTEAECASLRSYIGGRLKTTHIYGHKDLLPVGGNLCRTETCFKAGDFRVNMFPSLAGVHTLFLREHNRIAEELQRVNPTWGDELLYQESRKIVGAIIQHIAYNEFLPIILGNEYMKLNGLQLLEYGYSKEYNYNVNPTVLNAFTTAAFRFGHSLIQPQFKRYYMNHKEASWSPWLGDEYFNASCLWKVGELDELMVGLINQHAQVTDPFFTQEITNRLYEPGILGSGQDLIAINIQRGRDNGIAPYNYWREYCGLKRVHAFEELKEFMNEYSVGIFQRIYKNVDDIDLYVGGISENPVPGGIVGPTFACIIGKQFYRLRNGDRFWFENAPANGHLVFTLDQLGEIRKSSLARIICDNSEHIESVQARALLVPSDWNPRLYCSDFSIPVMDLRKWREDYSEPYFLTDNYVNSDNPHSKYRKMDRYR